MQCVAPARAWVRWLLRAGVSAASVPRRKRTGRVATVLAATVGAFVFVPNAFAADPVIAAAGDIACDPGFVYYNSGAGTPSWCHQRATSDTLISLRDAGELQGVLTLGDTQYDDNAYAKYLVSFDPTWGRLKALIHPTLGNHEFMTAGATGYCQYFGAAAHCVADSGTDAGWYSFDIGSWHLISLNANCAEAGGCGVGSPQETWLKADLAAHPATCTLAYWHQPRFSSGYHGNDATYQPFWQDLYDAGADVVLAGHDHVYERFAPQDPLGELDLARGMREFVVGVGGKSRSGFATIRANSEVRSTAVFGVLKLTLHPASYEWQFLPDGNQIFSDSGSDDCNAPVSADGSVSRSWGPLPLEVSFDGTASSGRHNDTLSYDWNFGDGSAHADTAIASHSYSEAGRFTAALTVADNHGGSDTVSFDIFAGDTPPTPMIEAPLPDKLFAVGQEITLRGSANDDEEGLLSDSALTWVVVRHHDPPGAPHVHPFLPPTSGNDVPIVGPLSEDMSSVSNSYLEIRLTATDSMGLPSTVTQDLRPHIVNLGFDSDPTGLSLNLAGATVTTPAIVPSWEGLPLTVNAPTQLLSGEGWGFGSWSDGGAQQHDITTPATDASYTATYTDNGPAAAPSVSVVSAIPASIGGGSSTITYRADVEGLTQARLGDCSGTVLASGSYAPTTDATFEVQAVDLTEGLNTVAICMTDTTGYSGSAAVQIEKNTSGPRTTITLEPAIPGGARGWYTRPVGLRVGATDDNGVAETRCVLDPAGPPVDFEAMPVGCPYSGAGGLVTGQGSHVLYAASKDVSGNLESPRSQVFKLDSIAPVASLVSLSAFQPQDTYPVSWSATETGSGLGSFDVRYRQASLSSASFGPFVGWRSATSATSASLNSTPGKTVCFSVRARDLAGNVSAYSGEQCTAKPLDDRALTRSGTWTLASGSAFYLGTISRSSTVASKLTSPSVTGKRLALLVTKQTSGGTIEIRWKGVLVQTTSLKAGSLSARQLVTLPDFAANQTGQLSVRVSGTGKVEIDGVGVWKRPW